MGCVLGDEDLFRDRPSFNAGQPAAFPKAKRKAAWPFAHKQQRLGIDLAEPSTASAKAPFSRLFF
jgi:hypothetical protein